MDHEDGPKEGKEQEQLIEPNLDLDELLPVVGEFGPYQKLMLWLVCLPAYIPCGFCAFNELFMADVPPHWCDTAELRLLTNFSNERRRVLTIPPSQEVTEAWDSCYRYAVNWSEILKYSDSEIEPNISWPIEYCPQGWEYNMTEIVSYIVIDLSSIWSPTMPYTQHWA